MLFTPGAEFCKVANDRLGKVREMEMIMAEETWILKKNSDSWDSTSWKPSLADYFRENWQVGPNFYLGIWEHKSTQSLR